MILFILITERVKENMMDSKGGKKKSRVIVPYLMKPPLVTALKMFVLAMESRNSILLIVTMQLKSSIWLHFMKPPPNIV